MFGAAGNKKLCIYIGFPTTNPTQTFVEPK